MTSPVSTEYLSFLRGAHENLKRKLRFKGLDRLARGSNLIIMDNECLHSRFKMRPEHKPLTIQQPPPSTGRRRRRMQRMLQLISLLDQKLPTGNIKRNKDTDNKATSCKSTINTLIKTQRGDPDIWPGEEAY